jgi:hypothetical protein
LRRPFEPRRRRGICSSCRRESAAALQFFTTQDIDDFHGVFCTDNWFFPDAAGQRHAWSDMRGQAARLVAEPHATSISQPISRVSLTRDGAVTLATLTTVHDVIDDEGRYGRKGARYTLTESTKTRTRGFRSEMDGSSSPGNNSAGPASE